MSPQPNSVVEGWADADGDRIHYVEQGAGAPLLLVHGAFGGGHSFLQTAFGQALAARHRVIAPDSLAHGDSAAPADRSRYGARRRAGHLAAVLDAAGVQRAHVVGYSMGGWMASALATHHADRIASLAVGGWDVVRGMYTPAAAWSLPEITYDILAAMVRRERPEKLAWLRPENEPALAAAVDAMNDLAGLAEGVARLSAPAAIWIGRDDLYHAAGGRYAEANGLAFLSLPGDHISAIERHGPEAAEAVLGFINTAAARGRETAVR